MQVNLLRKLDLEVPLFEGMPAHVAAASGLVRVGDWFHVMPDDSLHLATFALKGSQPGRSHRLLPDGDLPIDEKARKKVKPDLESLTLVPYGDGGQALLAVGSGSTERRRRGILQPLFQGGEVDGPAKVIDLTPLYETLPFPELNIEGAAVVGKMLFLGQRGVGSEVPSALIELDLDLALEALVEGRSWTSQVLLGVRQLDLGEVKGVRLHLTDLCPFRSDGLLIAAAAEDTDNSYDDGEVLGSVLAHYSLAEGTVATQSLGKPWKVEGVDLLAGGRVLMVTDGDNPDEPAELLEARDVKFELTS